MGNKKCKLNKSIVCAYSCKEYFNCPYNKHKSFSIHTNVDFNFGRRRYWKMFEINMLIQKFVELLPYALIGIFNGFGTAIGVYFAQRSFIKHLDKVKKWTGTTGLKN